MRKSKKQKPKKKNLPAVIKPKDITPAPEGDLLLDAINESLPDSKELTEKFLFWVKLFTEPGTEYYGNKTRCAMKAYNTDKYWSAAKTGYRNWKKLQTISQDILEQNNFGYAEMIKLGIAKVISGSYSDWDKMMERIGYFEKEGKSEGTNFNFSNLNVLINNDRKERGLPPLEEIDE